MLGHISISIISECVSIVGTLRYEINHKMKFYLYLISILLIFFSCNQKEETETSNISDSGKEMEVKLVKENIRTKNIIDPPMEMDSSKHEAAYKRLLREINTDKVQLQRGLNQGNISLDSVGNYFTRIMRDSVFHYWYGTTWEFNGHTNIPRDGEVACGYFISTPLKHIGVNVNRYKLAQQAATPIIKSISPGGNILYTGNINELETHLNKQAKDGLYVIGLSFHVGFILRENGENFMVHSDYYPPVAVCKKSFASCEALHSSEVYVLGELSGNPTFLKKWLNGERINILSK